MLQLIEVLFHEIEEVVEDITVGKRSYDPLPVISRVYLLILRTGLYSDHCKGWKNETTENKTWVNFKTHFIQIYRVLKMMQTASRQARCNVVKDEINDESTDITDIIEAIVKIATI